MTDRMTKAERRAYDLGWYHGIRAGAVILLLLGAALYLLKAMQ